MVIMLMMEMIIIVGCGYYARKNNYNSVFDTSSTQMVDKNRINTTLTMFIISIALYTAIQVILLWRTVPYPV